MNKTLGRIGIFSIAFLLNGCALQYVPPADGCVSVIDLMMFSNLYVNKTITSYGHLVVDPAGSAATLFFHADHAARRGERFALPITFTSDVDEKKLKGCSGQEVLMRGVVTKTPAGISLQSGNDFVC